MKRAKKWAALSVIFGFLGLFGFGGMSFMFFEVKREKSKPNPVQMLFPITEPHTGKDITFSPRWNDGKISRETDSEYQTYSIQLINTTKKNASNSNQNSERAKRNLTD